MNDRVRRSYVLLETCGSAQASVATPAGRGSPAWKHPFRLQGPSVPSIRRDCRPDLLARHREKKQARDINQNTVIVRAHVVLLVCIYPLTDPINSIVFILVYICDDLGQGPQALTH